MLADMSVRCGSLVLLALALGCGGEESSPAASGGAAGMNAGAGAGGTALGGAAGATSAGSSNGGTPSAAGAASGAGGSAGSALEPLVPLVTGHESTFEQVTLDPNGPMNTCVPLTAKVGESATIGGKQGVLYGSPCDQGMQYLLVGSGDQLKAYLVMGDMLGPTEFEYVHSPIVDAETWVSGGLTYTWHAVTEPVVTKAGTFDHECWERSNADIMVRFTYCRGTGLVKMRDQELNYEITIASKNF